VKKETPIDYERVRAFDRAGGAKILDRLIRQAKSIAMNPRMSFQDKADTIMTIAENISLAITPHTPCVKGCSHCCYMAVEVSAFEADMIGRYLGRRKATDGWHLSIDMDLKQAKQAQDESVRKYTGVRCTLLGDDGKCTVYPVRPIACRTHHNMAPDETNCVIVVKPGEELPTTPHINLNEFLFYQAAVMVQGKTAYADIREWFPAPDK
jgi:Fe-S-cluster containining protein